MAVVPQSATGDPFATRFSIYKVLSSLKTYSLCSLEDAFAVAKGNPTYPRLIRGPEQGEENDGIGNCIGNLEMSIISAETALEESVQLIERNYCILLDRRIAQFSSDDFASDSGSNVSEGHCNSNTNDTMGQSPSEPYDKLALLRSQVYFHRWVSILLRTLSMMRSHLRPSSPSTVCASPPHSSSESYISPPTPGSIVPHDPFLPTPDQSPAFTMTALKGMIERLECASSSYEEQTLASTSSTDETPEPVDENLFAWLALQGQLTTTAAPSLPASPQLPLAFADNAQVSDAISDSLEPIDIRETSVDTNTLSLPTPPLTTKLSTSLAFNEEILDTIRFSEPCVSSPIQVQGFGTPIPDIEQGRHHSRA